MVPENNVENGGRRRKGYRVAFLLVFAGTMLAESLVFLLVQMRDVALVLKEDFRIVVVKSDRVKRESAGMEEEFMSLPGTAEVSFVSRGERLRRLRETDPDLVSAVTGMVSNPMPDTFDIALDESALGNLNAWVEAAWKIKGVEEIKYKPLAATAILHALFYGHYIALSLAMALVALAALVLMTVFYRRGAASLPESLRRDRNWFFTGLAAGASAAVLSYAMVYPVKYLSPLWLWPGVLWQAAIITSGGVCAWVLSQWKNTH